MLTATTLPGLIMTQSKEYHPDKPDFDRVTHRVRHRANRFGRRHTTGYIFEDAAGQVWLSLKCDKTDCACGEWSMLPISPEIVEMWVKEGVATLNE